MKTTSMTNEVVILISFELTLGDLRGMINLCIPFNAIERIGGKLSANTWTSYGRKDVDPELLNQITQNLHGSEVEVVVDLAETRITTRELIGLRVGDVIKTEKDVHAPLNVSIQGVEKFHAKVGQVKGQKAIRIETVVSSNPHTKRAS